MIYSPNFCTKARCRRWYCSHSVPTSLPSAPLSGLLSWPEYWWEPANKICKMDRLHNWLRDHLNQSKTLQVRFVQCLVSTPILDQQQQLSTMRCKLSDSGSKVKFTSSACLSPVLPVDSWHPTNPSPTTPIQGAAGKVPYIVHGQHKYSPRFPETTPIKWAIWMFM